MAGTTTFRRRDKKFSKKMQRTLDPSMLLSRGLSARFVGANVMQGITTLSKDEIEKAFGGTLSWERLDTKRACRIKHVIDRGGYRSPESEWPEIQAEMVETMAKLEASLKPGIDSLGL